MTLNKRSFGRQKIIKSSQQSFINNVILKNQESAIALILGKYINRIGLWRDYSGRGVHLLAYAAGLCYTGNLVFQFIAVFMAKDVQRLFECLSVLTFCTMAILKLISLQRYHKNWQRLIFSIKKMEKKYYNMKHNETDYGSENEETTIPFSEYIHRYSTQFQSLSVVQSRIYYFTVAVFVMMPFVEFVFWKIQGHDVGKPHVLPIWAPWDEYSFFAYLVSISSEVIACAFCNFVHLAFDMTAVGLMVFICGQFTILRDYSELIGGRGKNYALSKKRDERAHFRIAICHQSQIFLVSCLSDLNKLLKNILGIYFFVATLSFCSVGLRLILETLPMMQLISLLQYTCGILAQLFFFCYYGNAVQQESSLQMGEGPFGAATWCLSPRARRELSLLAFGMMKLRSLSAGPFNTVDLPSFQMILRTAYSYYAVLQQQS